APDGTVYTVLVPHPALYEVLTCINGSNGQASLNDPTTLNVDAQMIATMNAYWKPMSIYLQENGCSEEAQEEILDILVSANNNSLVTAFPFVKYPDELAEEYTNDYPHLTEYLKEELPKLAEDDLMIQALTEYGSLTEEQIR